MAATARTFKVGGIKVSRSDAKGWVAAYLDVSANRTSRKPFAYPAYDDFTTGSAPDELNDGDLLAPGLLNVPVKIRPFYSLQRVRPDLLAGLAAIPAGLSLTEADDDTVRELTSGLYRVLDGKPRPVGVKETLLSKVLHRKRPKFLVLHDTWVQRCYIGEDGPVPIDKKRNYADKMTAMSLAIRHDLVSQQDVWHELAAVAPQAPVTPVRLLDIVCWRAGQQ